MDASTILEQMYGIIKKHKNQGFYTNDDILNFIEEHLDDLLGEDYTFTGVVPEVTLSSLEPTALGNYQ